MGNWRHSFSQSISHFKHESFQLSELFPIIIRNFPHSVYCIADWGTTAVHQNLLQMKKTWHFLPASYVSCDECHTVMSSIALEHNSIELKQSLCWWNLHRPALCTYQSFISSKLNSVHNLFATGRQGDDRGAGERSDSMPPKTQDWRTHYYYFTIKFPTENAQPPFYIYCCGENELKNVWNMNAPKP